MSFLIFVNCITFTTTATKPSIFTVAVSIFFVASSTNCTILVAVKSAVCYKKIKIMHKVYSVLQRFAGKNLCYLIHPHLEAVFMVILQILMEQD